MRRRWIALSLGLLCTSSCSSHSNGRDSGKQAAVRSPAIERFVGPSDGIVRDAHTGLEWTSHDNSSNVAWHPAARYCSELTLGERTDWRLPEIGELKELYDEGVEQPCGDVVSCHVDPSIELSNPYLWSATARKSRRYYFDFRFGNSLAPRLKPGLARRVLCVRRFKPLPTGSNDADASSKP